MWADVALSATVDFDPILALIDEIDGIGEDYNRKLTEIGKRLRGLPDNPAPIPRSVTASLLKLIKTNGVMTQN